MTMRTVIPFCVAIACAAACTPAGKQEGQEDLAAFAHDRVGDEVKHTTLVDFGSKVQLVAYDISPDGTARPGDSIHLTLYWKRSGRLDPGWGLFTHLEDEQGRQISNFDREGGFRGAIAGKPDGLARLEAEKIYTDEQNLTVPKGDAVTPNIALVVGVWNDSMRLPVVSGQSDGHDAAIISHFATGVPRRALALTDKKKSP
jgi:hypothetical protein